MKYKTDLVLVIKVLYLALTVLLHDDNYIATAVSHFVISFCLSFTNLKDICILLTLMQKLMSNDAFAIGIVTEG